jgi:hypothetical protein
MIRDSQAWNAHLAVDSLHFSDTALRFNPLRHNVRDEDCHTGSVLSIEVD